MALGRYAIGEGMTLSLAARADQRSLFAGLTSIVQRTVFFALAAAAPHASIVSRLSRARLAAATIPSQLAGDARCIRCVPRSEEHTSELQSLMRISYAGFCLKKKKIIHESKIHEGRI